MYDPNATPDNPSITADNALAAPSAGPSVAADNARVGPTAIKLTAAYSSE